MLFRSAAAGGFTVSLAGSDYSFVAGAGDTPGSVAAQLKGEIDGKGGFTATVSGAVVTVTKSADFAVSAVANPVSATITTTPVVQTTTLSYAPASGKPVVHEEWSATLGGHRYSFLAGSGGTTLDPGAVAAGLKDQINGQAGFTAAVSGTTITVTKQGTFAVADVGVNAQNPALTIEAPSEKHTRYEQTLTLDAAAPAKFHLKTVDPALPPPTVTVVRAEGKAAIDSTWTVGTDAADGDITGKLTYRPAGQGTEIDVSVTVPVAASPSVVADKITQALSASIGKPAVPPDVVEIGRAHV